MVKELLLMHFETQDKTPVLKYNDKLQYYVHNTVKKGTFPNSGTDLYLQEIRQDTGNTTITKHSFPEAPKSMPGFPKL